MNTNNSVGDKAPFVVLWYGWLLKTEPLQHRRVFWSLDLSHAERAAKAWVRKRGGVVLSVNHVACSSDVENADGSPSASSAAPTRTP